MPLRALVDGRELQVWDLTGEQWQELKRRSRTAEAALRMACCGAPAIAKTSRSGNPFFAHHPQARPATACRWAAESALHAGCKLLAAAGARAAGWQVRTEVAAADGSWRADVLCRRGACRVALEIQLARTGLEDLRLRQERYRRAGIRGAWFVPPGFCPEPSPALPAFALKVERHAPEATWVRLDDGLSGTPATLLPLDGFVAHLLHGRVRFEPERIVRPLAGLIAVTAPDRCRRCAAPFEHVVGVTNIAVGPPRYCIDGASIVALRDLWQGDRRQAWTLICGLGRLRRQEPLLSPAAPRRCRVVGEAYLMACCPRCGAGQGDGAIDRLLTSLHPRTPVRVPIPPAPLTFWPLNGRPPRRAALNDWLGRVVPARWQLTGVPPETALLPASTCCTAACS
jgi:hypothetical protein